MSKNDIKMAVCIVIAIIAIMVALIWANAVNKLNDMYIERNAHLQMQIEQYERLMMDREARIHELEKEIAADK